MQNLCRKALSAGCGVMNSLVCIFNISILESVAMPHGGVWRCVRARVRRALVSSRSAAPKTPFRIRTRRFRRFPFRPKLKQRAINNAIYENSDRRTPRLAEQCNQSAILILRPARVNCNKYTSLIKYQIIVTAGHRFAFPLKGNKSP